MAGAQSWPAKPIRIVLQFPPGGSTDLVARILGQALSQSLGQQGFELAGSTPDELGTFVQEQLKAWERAFREAGMQPE